jgi:hypothetical protein
MSQDSPIDRLLDQVVWEPIPAYDDHDDTIPYATHSGVLTIPGVGTLRVYQLNTGKRVINAQDLNAFFGSSEETDE